MKTQSKYYKASPIFFVLFFFLFPLSIISQTFTGNIPIPSTDGGGAIIGDIIHANDHIFVYSLDKLVAYNLDGDFVGEIIFEPIENYGKSNPIYFWDSRHSSSISLMAYNNDINAEIQILYVISPDLKIYIVDISQNSFLNYSIYIPPVLSNFKPIHGLCILKFDNVHDRLYWLIDSRHPTANGTGSFHVRQRYFFIFEVNNSINGAISSVLFSEHEYSNTPNYEYANISDIEFNMNIDTNLPDYFYLSKINRLEVWSIDFSHNPPVYLLNTYQIDLDNYGTPLDPCEYYKFGGMHYIHDQTNGIHKIIAFPYRFPGETVYGPDIFVLDGEHTIAGAPINWVTSSSPSQKITDAAYLADYQHLILSYAADPDNIPPPFNQDHDISIFQVSGAPGSNLVWIDGLGTDDSQSLPFYKDFNTPFDIVPVSKTTAMICKEDEICYLHNTSTGYESDSKLDSENNFFRKGISLNNGEKFVMNVGENGFQILDYLCSPTQHIESGYQVNHVCMDNNGDKFYFFNKLNTCNTGCYVYENSEAHNINSFHPGDVITAPIGDCIYNPFLDHFLISENGYFDNRSARVLVFNNDTDNSTNDPIELKEGTDLSYFAKKMFISPDGKLYVMADMNYDLINHPKVFIFSAEDETYPPLGVYEVSSLPLTTWPYPDHIFDFYNAHFCYNHHNNKVYATINPQAYIMCPYNASSNGMFGPYTGTTANSGVLVELDENQIMATIQIPLNIPGKIICPDNGNPDIPSRYGEKMFIIGSMSFHEVNPPYNDPDSITSHSNQEFNDITYNPKHDILFTLRDDPQHPTNAPRHRIFKVFSFDYDVNDDPVFTLMTEYGGQATSIFNNPYDGNIYVHQKTDEHKLGVTPVRLLHFDYDPAITPPATQNVSPVSLELNSLYPEIDHNDDFNFYLYNITTPAINPYNNTMYIPNGGHSCVSKVTFDANEALQLQTGDWSWISFPRIDRDDNDAVSIPLVLDNNITPNTYPNIYQDDSKLQYYTYEGVMNESFYTITSGWNSSGNLDEVKSTLGYKLFLKYTPLPVEKWLYMQGNLYDHFDPNCSNCRPFNLNGTADEYWVGYYHLASQTIPDALPDEIESQIHMIKGQYFTCYSEENQTDGIIWRCVCNKGTARLKYGDMAIITPKPGEIINDFYWALYNNTPTDEEKAAAEYYAFTETADYTPIFVELDTTENPQEIGAFVNDSCIGGTTVLPDDTVVLISAYSDSLNGEIYFEEYYGTQKSYRPSITDYYVTNQETRIKEKRLIHTREQQDYYIVSFKNGISSDTENAVEDAWIKCRPNPVRSNGTIICYIPTDGFVEIKLYDIMGTEQRILHQGMINTGTHEFSFSGKNASGKQLPNGTYVLSMTSEKYQAQIKIIIL